MTFRYTKETNGLESHWTDNSICNNLSWDSVCLFKFSRIFPHLQEPEIEYDRLYPVLLVLPYSHVQSCFGQSCSLGKVGIVCFHTDVIAPGQDSCRPTHCIAHVGLPPRWFFWKCGYKSVIKHLGKYFQVIVTPFQSLWRCQPWLLTFCLKHNSLT